MQQYTKMTKFTLYRHDKLGSKKKRTIIIFEKIWINLNAYNFAESSPSKFYENYVDASVILSTSAMCCSN